MKRREATINIAKQDSRTSKALLRMSNSNQARCSIGQMNEILLAYLVLHPNLMNVKGEK